MKKLFIIAAVILFIGTAYSQTDTLQTPGERWGIITGSPVSVMFGYGQDRPDYSYRICAGVWIDNTYGVQGELIYPIDKVNTFEQSFGLIAGYCYGRKLEDPQIYNFIYGGVPISPSTIYSFYYGLSYRVNWTNIFLQVSMANGSGNFRVTRLLLQGGYYFYL